MGRGLCYRALGGGGGTEGHASRQDRAKGLLRKGSGRGAVPSQEEGGPAAATGR